LWFVVCQGCYKLKLQNAFRFLSSSSWSELNDFWIGSAWKGKHTMLSLEWPLAKMMLYSYMYKREYFLCSQNYHRKLSEHIDLCISDGTNVSVASITRWTVQADSRSILPERGLSDANMYLFHSFHSSSVLTD
jgi:hypothetical protein